MASLVDIIEAYLKRMLEERDAIEIQRNELATQFTCVPSQINYVLQTRFSVERGYIIESRRGGGGYIRITKLRLNNPDDMSLVLEEGVGEAISEEQAIGLINQLVERDMITSRESQLVKIVMKHEVLNTCLLTEDQIRARLLKSMLFIIMQVSFQQDCNN